MLFYKYINVCKVILLVDFTYFYLFSGHEKKPLDVGTLMYIIQLLT